MPDFLRGRPQIKDPFLRTKLYEGIRLGARNVPGPSALETDYTGNPMLSRFGSNTPSQAPLSYNEQSAIRKSQYGYSNANFASQVRSGYEFLPTAESARIREQNAMRSAQFMSSIGFSYSSIDRGGSSNYNPGLGIDIMRTGDRPYRQGHSLAIQMLNAIRPNWNPNVFSSQSQQQFARPYFDTSGRPQSFEVGLGSTSFYREQLRQQTPLIQTVARAWGVSPNRVSQTQFDSFAMLHELGHVSQYQTMDPLQRDRMQKQQIIAEGVYRNQGMRGKELYRQLPLESSADKFASDIIFNQRFQTANRTFRAQQFDLGVGRWKSGGTVFSDIPQNPYQFGRVTSGNEPPAFFPGEWEQLQRNNPARNIPQTPPAPNPNMRPQGPRQWTSESYQDPRTGKTWRSGSGSSFQGGGFPIRGPRNAMNGGIGGGGPMPPPENMPPAGGSWSVWQSNATNIMQTYQQRPFNQDDLQKARDAIGFLQKFGPVMEKLAQTTGKLTEKQEKQIRVGEKAYEALDRAERGYQRALKSDEGFTAAQGEYGRISGAASGLLRRYLPAYRAAGAIAGSGGQFSAELGRIGAQEEPTIMELLGMGGKSGRRARAVAFQEGGVLAQSGIGRLLGETGVEGLSSGMRMLSRGLSRMWMGSTARGILSNPVFGAMDYYSGAASLDQLTLMRSGALGAVGPTGTYANVLNRAASREAATYALGQQAYSAWGNVDPRMNANLARGAGGMAQAILGPSLATGVQLGIFNPALGAAAAAGQAAFGLANYTLNNATNYNAIGQVWAGNGRQNMFNNAAGVTGGIGAYLNIGANALLGNRNYAMGQLQNIQAATVANAFTNKGAGIQDITQVMGALGLGTQQAQEFATNAVISQFQERYQGVGTTPEEVAQSRNRMTQAALRATPNLRATASPVANAAQWMEQYGVGNYTEAAMGIAGTRGRTGFAAGDFSVGITDYYDYLQNALRTGTPIDVAMQEGGQAINRAGRLNAAARLAGERESNWRQFTGPGYEFRNDTTAQGIQDTWGMTYYSARQGLRQQGIGASIGRNVGTALRQQDYYNASRIVGQFGQALNYDQQMLMYGVNNQDAARRISTLANAGEQDFAAMQGLAQGNARVASQQWQRLGNIRFQTMDIGTGMNAFYNNVSAPEYNWLRQDSNIAGFQQFRLTQQQAAGGQRAWQARATQATRGLEAYQYQQQRESRNLDYIMTTGGQGLDNQSATTLGRGLERMAEVFEKYGVPFSAGNGMGVWQIQDRQQQINRAQQMFQMQQGGQNLAINEAQFALQGRQFYERQGLQQRRFDWSTAYQRQEMQIGRYQQVTQQGWQREDMAFSRNQSELNFGWSMQDYDRNIRFARGRERRDLMRQKAREVIQFSMQQGQMDRQEGRFEQQTQWSKEAYDRQRQYFEEGVRFQQEEMDMQRRHFEENRGLERQRLDLQRQGHEQQIAWIREEWGLQDQQRLLERQSYQLQYKMQSDMDERVRDTQLTVQLYNDALQASNDRLSEANAQLQAFAANLSVLDFYSGYNSGQANAGTAAGGYTAPSGTNTSNNYAYYGNVSGSYSSSAGSAMGLPPVTGTAAGTGGRSTPTAYAAGGYTGDGPMYAPAGSVHKGEYVVPSGGGLVLRGDNPRSILLMERMVELLAEIAENPTTFQAVIQNPLNLRNSTLQDVSRATPVN